MKKKPVKKYVMNVPAGHELAEEEHFIKATFIRGKSQWPIDKEGLLGYIEGGGKKKAKKKPKKKSPKKGARR